MTPFALTSVRRSNLAEITSRMPGLSCQGQVGEFLDVYLVAESLLHRLISYYLKDTAQKHSKDLRTDQITAALIHFNFTVSKHDVIKAFKGGTGKRGYKSARQLRNGFLHDLNTEDREEIIAKASLLKESISRVVSPLVATASVT